MTKTESSIVLFSVTICFSCSYIFIKNIPESFSAFAYLTITVGIAFLLLAGIFHKKLKKLSFSVLKKSAVLAFFTFGNLLMEKKGLETMDASMASFLAAMNIIFVPLILLCFGQKREKNQVAGIFFIVFGLFLTSQVNIKHFWSSGVVFMILSSCFMSVYIILTGKFSREEDPVLLCMGQMCFTAVIGFIFWFQEDSRTVFSIHYTKELVANLFFLSFFVKAYAYLMMMYAQKYANPVNVTIIASLEPIITMIIAAVIPEFLGKAETVNSFKIMGAICITAGAILSGFEKKKRRENNGRDHKTFLL